jgi:hypothetical protein
MKKIIENNNRMLQLKMINSIKRLPKHELETLATDPSFNLPIVKLSKNQKIQLQNLIN